MDMGGEHSVQTEVSTGGAIAYALREGLEGQVEIDNNLVENAIRPAALGRKNGLFIGDEQAEMAQCGNLYDSAKL